MLKRLNKTDEGGGGNGSGTGTGSMLDNMLDTSIVPQDEPKVISEDPKAVELGGFGYSTEGNLVDKEGKVLKTKEELAGATEPGAGTDVELFLDATGNVVDKDNNVVIKKEDVKLDEHGKPIIPEDIELPETPLVNDIINSIGIKIKDDKGVEKVYSDDIKGIGEYIKDTNKILLQRELSKFFESNPEVRNFYQHLATGNKAEDYFKPTKVWSEIDITKADDATKYNLVYDSLIRRNLGVEEAKSITEMYKTGGTLTEQATKAQALHKELDEQEAGNREEAYNAKLKQYENEQVAYWNKVNGVVKGGKIGITNAADTSTLKSIEIPQTEREEFFDYLSSSVTDAGLSQEMIDRQKETLETKIALAYLRYKKFDLSSLVKAAVGNQKVATLKARLNKNLSGGGSKIAQKDANASEITLDSILG